MTFKLGVVLLLPFLLAAALASASCGGGGDGDGDLDADADVNTDADLDGDADGEPDCDVDADGDADVDGDVDGDLDVDSDADLDISDADGSADAESDAPDADVDVDAPDNDNCITGEPFPEDPRLADLIRLYNEANCALNGGDGYIAYSNREAILSQNEPAVIASYLVMYQATSSVEYLRIAINHADAILAWRDDVTGLLDYSGASPPAWSDAHYNADPDDDRAYPYALESGELVYPIADLAQIVINDSALHGLVHPIGRSYLDIALGYRDRVAETLAFHAERFHTEDGLDHPLGWFSVRPDADFLDGLPPGRPLPLNMDSAMGRAHLMLWLAFRDDEPDRASGHLDVARRLAYYALLEMEWVAATEAYRWHYWPLMSYYPEGYVDNGGNTSWEDLSHAALTVELAWLCWHHGAGIFYDEELRRLSRTLRLHLLGEPPFVHRRVDGSGDALEQRYQLGVWLKLIEAEPEHTADTYRRIYETLIDHMGLGPDALGSASGLLALAELVRSWDPAYVP